MKSSITKSRAGHYTATVESSKGRFKVKLINHLGNARRILGALKKMATDSPASDSVFGYPVYYMLYK